MLKLFGEKDRGALPIDTSMLKGIYHHHAISKYEMKRTEAFNKIPEKTNKSTHTHNKYIC